MSMHMLIIKFKQTWEKLRLDEDIPSDNAIRMMLRRWMKRDRISLRRIINVAQNTVCEQCVMDDFVEFVNNYNFDNIQIDNASDEVMFIVEQDLDKESYEDDDIRMSE